MKAEEIIRTGQKVGQEPGPRRVTRREFIRDFKTGNCRVLFAAADGEGGLYHKEVPSDLASQPLHAAYFSVNEKDRHYAAWRF